MGSEMCIRDRVSNMIVSHNTVRRGSPSEFVLVLLRDPDVCPVLWLDYYVRACQALGVSLSGRYFFRASDREKQVGGRPFLGTAVYNRLRVCLSEAKLCNGETPHSFRVGLSNTLIVLGCSPEEIAQYSHCIYNERITLMRRIPLILRVWVSGCLV